MGAFDTDFAAADALFAEAFGGVASLHRDSQITLGVTAEVVECDHETYEAFGAETVAQERTYVFDVADYKFSGVAAAPAAGDVIKETIGGVVHKFEVMPLNGRPCYEWAGAQKPQWRVHAKFIGTE